MFAELNLSLEGIVNYCSDTGVTHYSLLTKRYYQKVGDKYFTWFDNRSVEVENVNESNLVLLDDARRAIG